MYWTWPPQSSVASLCVHRGTHHWVPRTQRLFGGQIVGQALVAAAKSVGDNLFAHSLHCYFVRAGQKQHNFKWYACKSQSGLVIVAHSFLLHLKEIPRFQSCIRWNAQEMAAVSAYAQWRPFSMDSLYLSAKHLSTCSKRVPCSTSSPCPSSLNQKTSSL